MNYATIYQNLVDSRKNLNRKFTVGCGYEKHHIVPKSLGGSNKKDNLVVLTPREHCLAHILLTKMYTGEAKGKMCYALIALSKLRNKHRSSITTREYDRLRKAYYASMMDPDYRALRSANTAKQWTDERREQQAKRMVERWADPSSSTSIAYSSDEYKAKKRVDHQKRLEDPEYLKQLSDNTKKQWADPNKRPDRNR